MLILGVTLQSSNKAEAITYLQIVKGVTSMKKLYDDVNKIFNITLDPQIRIEASGNRDLRYSELFKLINHVSDNIDNIGNLVSFEKILKIILIQTLYS